MKRALIKAFLHLLPWGFEVHPKRIEKIILMIAPEIETRNMTQREMYYIREKFKRMIIAPEGASNIEEYYVEFNS